MAHRIITLLLAILLSLSIASKAFSAPKIVLGADISWLTEMEDDGMQWRDHTGGVIDPYPWLKEQGLSALRFRLWVDAHDDYNGIDDVIAKAKRAEQLGLDWMLDFHFSDTWADPGQQKIPVTWRDHSLSGLKASIAQHISKSLSAIKKAGVTPKWIQVGNEVNHGFLWPVGHTVRNKSNFVEIYQHASDVIHQHLPQSKLILHIADCSNLHQYYELVPHVLKAGTKVDIIGVSAYAYWSKEKSYSDYHEQCGQNLNKLKTAFNREVMVVEFGAQWDGKDSTALTQNFYQSIAQVKQDTLVVFYWEPMASPEMKYPLGAFSPAGTPMPLWDEFVNPVVTKEN
jgi:arabinogalactan endo-1,4-beta-galactosidase